MAHDDEHGHKAAAAVPEWAPPAFGPSKMPWLEVEDVTCFCCVKRNPIRNFFLILTRSSNFSMFMMLNIIANYVILAAYDPVWRGPTTLQDKIQNDLEPWFQAVFTAEAAMKLVALGAWGQHSYFSDGWNCFDFAVVVLCYINYVPNSGNATALRALRALRPLRSFGLVPQLRKTFNGILNVLFHIFKVEIVDWFLCFVFTLVCVQLFAGQMSGGCFYPDPNANMYSANYPMPTPSLLGQNSNTAGVVANTAWSVMPGFVRVRLINNLLYNADSGYGICALDAQSPAFAATNLPTLASFAPAPPACPVVTVDVCNGAPPDFCVTTAPREIQSVCLPFQNPMAWTGGVGMGMSYDNVGIGWLTSDVVESEEGWSTVVYGLWNSFGSGWFIALLMTAYVLIVDDFVSVLTDANTWVAYAEAMKSQEEQAAHDAEPENVKHSRALETKALDEMWGVNESHSYSAHEAAERRAAERAHNCNKSFWNGLSSAYNVFPGIPGPCKRTCGRVEGIPYFDQFFLAVVIANIISLACSGYGISDESVKALDLSNYVFVFIFVMELVIRIGAHGAKAFLSDGFNAFDFLIVVASVADIGVSLSGGSKTGLSSLRTLRVFRAFKLARSWKQLNALLSTLVRSLPPVGAILTILFVVILVFTAIGMQVFGGNYADAIAAGKIDEYPRNNFDHFGWGMASVFQIIEGENWFVPLYQHMAVLGPVAALYFCALNLMGDLVFGLVVAVFMQGFDAEEEEEMEHELHEQIEEAKKKVEAARAAGRASATGHGSTTFEFDSQHRAVKLVIDLPPRGLSEPNGIADAGAEDLLFDGRDIGMRVTFTPGAVHCVGVDQATGKVFDPAYLANESTAFDKTTLEHAEDKDAAFFVCGPKNGCRVAIAGWVTSKTFEWLTFAVTLLSCVNLALNEPWLDYCADGDAKCAGLKTYLLGCDAFVVAWFTFEMALKMVAQGVFAHGCLGGSPHGYFTSVWNGTDFVIVVTSIAGLAVGMMGNNGLALGAIRSIRGLRVLRVLRLIRQFSSISLIVDILVGMVPAALNAAVLVFLFMYIFAIIGMQTFGGNLNICNDFSVASADQCQGSFRLTGPNCAFLPTQQAEDACKLMGNASTIMFPRRFEPQLPNWDNFGNSMLQVYMIADGENWPSFMYNAVDGGMNPGEPMMRDNNQWNAIFFVVLLVVMDCVALDLFSGVVKVTYRHMKTKAGGRGYLTNGQRKMMDNVVLVMETVPHTRPQAPPAGSLRADVFRIVHDGSFDSVMAVVVVACTLVCAMWRYPLDGLTMARLNGLYYLFTLIFSAEVAARLFSEGAVQFAHSSWNLFKLATTLTAVVGAGLNLAAEAGMGFRLNFGVMRIALSLMALRFFEIVRGMRHSEGGVGRYMEVVQPVARAIWYAFFQVFQVSLFFTVVLFMYVIVGMAAFGNTRHGYAGDGLGGNPARSSGNLNGDANFEGFPKAFYTLYRSITGENWDMLLLDMSQDEPYCINADDLSDNCGDYIFSPIFWISFKILTDMCLDNLLSAIVLDAFWTHLEPESKFVGWADNAGRKLYSFSHAASEKFAEAWHDVIDPFGTAAGCTREQLAELVQHLDAPLGVKRGAGATPATADDAKDFVAQLPLEPSVGVIPFHMALLALVNGASAGHEIGGGGKSAAGAGGATNAAAVEVA